MIGVAAPLIARHAGTVTTERSLRIRKKVRAIAAGSCWSRARTGGATARKGEEKIETGQLVTAGTPGMEWSGAADGGEVRSLPCITLDDYATATNLWPGFLKIDVEGHEGRVLQGATRILETKPEMLIEIHSEALGSAIYDLLKKDYHVEQVLHPHYPRGSLLSRTHFWFRCFPLVRSSEV